MSGCKPKTVKSSVDIRLAELEGESNQDTLAKITLEDRSRVIRKAAVRKLYNSTLLEKIADNGDIECRYLAIASNQFNNQSVLTQIALSEKNPGLRRAAIKNMHFSDQTVLFRIVMEDQDVDVRFTAILKLTNQVLLATVALDNSQRLVQNVAISKIADSSLLEKIGVDSDDDHRLIAIANNNLTNQTLLVKIALEDKDPKLRASAIKNINLADQIVLSKIALEDMDEAPRIYAVLKLTNQELLAKIALEDSKPYVRGLAVQSHFFTNQVLIEKIVESTKGAHHARYPAIQKLTNQPMLASIALSDDLVPVRCTALGAMTDQTLLKKIATQSDEEFVRQEARKRIKRLNSPY